MALLKLPLSLNRQSGVLEKAGRKDDSTADRIRLFLFWTMGEFRNYGMTDLHEEAGDEKQQNQSGKPDKDWNKKWRVRELKMRGISEVWSQLYMMGPSSRFQTVWDDERGEGAYRKAIESSIVDQVNRWLDGVDEVKSVVLMGESGVDNAGVKVAEENGIRFSTRGMRYGFLFKPKKRGSHGGFLGSWDMMEQFDAIY